MAALTVRLPAATIEAFERMAATLALAEPGTDAPGLMARTLAVLANFDVEFLRYLETPAGEPVTLALTDDASTDLERLAGFIGTSSEVAAARVLVAAGEPGPREALRALNTWKETEQ